MAEEKSNKDPWVTGHFFLRRRGPAPDGSKRQLCMVVGVVAIPEDCEWKSEHMVPVVSMDGGCHLELIVEKQEDFTEKIPRGLGADQILTGRYWRY